MKSIIQAMLEEIYTKAAKIATESEQITDDTFHKRDFYITLQQLETILKEFEG